MLETENWRSIGNEDRMGEFLVDQGKADATLSGNHRVRFQLDPMMTGERDTSGDLVVDATNRPRDQVH